MKILKLFRNKVLECMKAAEDDPDDACIEEKRIIDDNHCHAIKDVSNESLSNESFFFVADEKQCRVKSEYQDYHISARFGNIEYTMMRLTKDQMSSDNRCQGMCVKKDVNLENEMVWHSSDTPKLSSNITKEENNLSKDDAENGCNYNTVYTQESSASIGYSKAVFESRSLGLMPSENSECLESLQNSSLLGDPKPCLNESYDREFDKDEIAREKLDVNSGEIPASTISDEDSTIWLTESRMLTRSSTQTDLTSFNIHDTDEHVRENTNQFRNLHFSAERGLQSCSDLQLLDIESDALLPSSFTCTCHNPKSELSPVSTSLNALNVESFTQNSLSMCRDAVSLNSTRQLYRSTNISSDSSVFTGTLDSFSPLSLQREKSLSLLSLGLRQSLSLYSLQSNLHQQELDQVASSNCMCSCKERSKLSASFWKTDELVAINKDGGEIGSLKDAEKSIGSRESEIGPCGFNGTNKINGREKTKPLDNDGISAGDANAFVDSSKENCYQSEYENGIHMAVKLHPDEEMPFIVNKATEEKLDDTVKIKSKESGDTSQRMGKQRITSRATDIHHILKLIMYFLNYFQGNDHERLDGEDKNYADLCKLYMETENEGINCDELNHEKIWLSSTRNKECFPKATPKECRNDGKCIIVPFSRAMLHVDWKMSSNMIAHKNETMNKVNIHYRINEMKEKSIVYFTVCENQHLIGPRAIFWLQFLDDDSEKYHNELRYLLQRFCPWIIKMPISAMTLDRVDNDCFCIHNPFKYTSLLRKELKYSTKNEECHFLCLPPLPPAISANSQNPVDAQDNNNPWNCASALVERNFTHSQCLQRSKAKLQRDSKNSDSKCATNCMPTKPYVSKNTNNDRLCIIQTQYTKPRKYLKKEVKKTQPTLMKNKLIREKRTKEKRLPRSVNSIVADSPANGKEVMNSMNQNPAMKPMTSDSCVFILELRSHSNERKKQFKHRLELNDSRKEEIKRHLVRFYKQYESTKHGRSESISLVSMEKIDSLSLPEMVFKIQSIPKGLGFLGRYLRISKDFKIASIETILPLQQTNQQPQEGLESVLQPLDNETRTESEDHMRSEWLRVTTFQTFPSDVGISSVKLAKNGFYYLGQNKETKCHFCSKTYNEWTSTSDIEAIHRQISPDCPFINGRETNNIPIHTSSNPSANQEGIFGNLQGGVIERLRINEESVHEETVGAETVGASVSSLTFSQDQIEQLPPSLPTPDRPEGKPPPTTALLTEARETDIKESSLQKPVSPQALSKSKLKREKKKRKKEEQTRIKGEPRSSQGGLVISEVPDKQEEVLSSLSQSSSVPPGLVIEEVQPSPGGNPNTQEEATSVEGVSELIPHSSQLTESKSLNSGVSRSSNESSGRSLSRQNSTNPSNPPQGGATAKAKSSGPNEGGAGPDRQPQGGSSQPAPSRGGANPPSQTPAERLAQLDPLGINFDKPKYPAYAVYSNRLSSFDGWPSHMAQTPRDMARAGYFYAGYGDYARCFFCGGGLRNWDRSDDPWTEHARWFPRCAFLRNNKGDRYVARIQRIHQEQEAGLEPSFQILAPQERDLDTPLAEALREMGYTNQIIQTAMDQWRRRLRPGRRHPPAMSAAGLLDIIEELEGNTEDRASVPTERPLTIRGADNNPAVEETSRPSEENTEDGVIMLQENRTGGLVAQGESRDYGYDQIERQERQILQEEFLGLTETLVCKICCDKDVAAAFLPCGHLVCCLDCAPAMRKCPLCGEVIKGTVKTYFA